MIASVSSAERESRLRVRLLARRTSQGATSGRVTILKPPPTSTIWSPRSRASYRALRSRTRARARATLGRSSTSWIRSASTGVSDAKRSASTTSMGWGISHLRTAPLDHDLPEQFPLPRPGLADPDQLQQSQEGHDQLRAGPLAPDQGREEQGPGVTKERENLPHAFEHRQRVGLHIAQRLPAGRLEQPAIGTLQQVEAQIFQGDLLGRRQLAPRAAAEERLLGFALREPEAEGLDARVLAQALLQLLAQQFPLLVQQFFLALAGAQEELGLEVDEGGRQHHEGAGRLQILELDGLKMNEILICDRADRHASEVHLVGPAEVE